MICDFDLLTLKLIPGNGLETAILLTIIELKILNSTSQTEWYAMR